ncbi:hypothetical protein [Sodalis praecaptivus]|uniref:hypothetical protein n=1 Tax=Sodalis praecaptivus TaxID=1239307 RepID=UPI0031F77D38
MGDMFPRDFVKAFVKNRELSPGDVLYLHCPFTTPPKEKYLLVACCSPLLVLIINSEVNSFIEARKELMRCQVELAQCEHEFLEWDSFVNCVEAHSAFSLEEIKEKVVANYCRIVRGRVVNYCMHEVYLAVKLSPTMQRRQKKQILEALTQYK